MNVESCSAAISELFVAAFAFFKLLRLREAAIGRGQLSRYFADGRLKKTAHGEWCAASIARVRFKALRWEITGDSPMENELQIVRLKYAFQWGLEQVAFSRRRAAGVRDSRLPREITAEIQEAARAYREGFSYGPEDHGLVVRAVMSGMERVTTPQLYLQCLPHRGAPRFRHMSDGVLAVLAGTAPPTACAAVILNAAAALYVAPNGPVDIGDAIDLARAGLCDGRGLSALDRLRLAHTT